MQASRQWTSGKRAFSRAIAVTAMLVVGACTIPLGGPDPAPPRSVTTQQQPTGTLVSEGQWVREDATDAQRRAAIDDCYNYALGSVRSSQQIEDDSQAARQTGADLRGYSDFQRRVQAHAGKRRIHTLFSECMQDRGYRRYKESN
ncbi:MAG: hypothetical protein R3316_00575 [Rhodovibrionaceae bacterium]|nr:hypothetical protein [Rhodovibrionaceae bacterium]